MADVLIVEDDRASWDVLQRRLRAMNVDAHIAESAELAQQFLKTEKYRLMIVDLSLPGIDGWQLFTWTLSTLKGGAPKMVALTAYYDELVLKQANEMGFAGCYSKPATQDIVQDIVSILAS